MEATLQQALIHIWANSLVEVSEQMSLAAVTIDASSLKNDLSTIGDDFSGSLISLSSDEATLYFGLLADAAALNHVAIQMYALKTNALISDEDKADATKEIVNIMAGHIKGSINEQLGSSYSLGIPTFITDKQIPTGTAACLTIKATINDFCFQLILIIAD